MGDRNIMAKRNGMTYIGWRFAKYSRSMKTTNGPSDAAVGNHLYIPVLLLTSIVEPEAVPVPDVPGGGLFAPRPALPANLAWLLADCGVPS